MTKRTPSSGSSGTGDIRGGGDRYDALLDVLEHERTQAARDRAREEAERQKRKRRRSQPYWLVAVLLVFVAWLWLFPPPILRVEPPAPQPVEQEEAALRLTMYAQAQRIAVFREEHGRLPESLEEAGPPLPNMGYAILNTGLYQLTGTTDRLTLTYRSDLPLDDFLGAATDIVDASRPR